MSDLIERQDAIDKMYNAFSYAYCNNCDKEDDEDRCGDFCHRKYINWAASKNTIEREINSLPSAEPERKTGRWIHIRTEPDGNALYECSECHKGEVHVPIVEVHYCWNCGVRMVGEQ